MHVVPVPISLRNQSQLRVIPSPHDVYQLSAKMLEQFLAKNEQPDKIKNCLKAFLKEGKSHSAPVMHFNWPKSLSGNTDFVVAGDYDSTLQFTILDRQGRDVTEKFDLSVQQFVYDDSILEILVKLLGLPEHSNLKEASKLLPIINCDNLGNSIYFNLLYHLQVQN